jgi:hypothetical protein
MERTSFDERKVGLIPRLVVTGKWGPKEYAILVTDKRTILVLEKESKSGIGGALGGAAGALIASAADRNRSFDYGQADPQSLATDSKNLTITHENLQKLLTKKRFIGPVHKLEMYYQTNEGKRKKLKGFLMPPGIHVKQRKREGAGRGQIYADYAQKLQEVYRNALSPPRFETVVGSHI